MVICISGMAEGESRGKRLVIHRRHYNMHDDLLMLVLSRIPSQSLMRFKCVSKHWFSLITGPSFVDLFLHSQSLSSLESRALFLLMSQYYFEKPRFHIVDWKKKQLDDRIRVHEPSLPGAVKYRPTNTVNGLVCLYRYYRHDKGCFFIHNLTTRENLRLPKVTILKDSELRRRCYLGFDPNNRQYKVLQVCLLPNDKVDCQVLALSQRYNTWRPINISSIHDTLKSSIPNYSDTDNGFCYDGDIYRASWNSYIQSNVIVAFNVEHETFEFIRYPQELMQDRWPISACQVGGHVSLVEVPSEFSSKTNIILWKLIDQKDKDRPLWTKEVITCPFLDFKWERVRCSDFGLLSLVRSPVSTDIAVIECYDLETSKYMVLKLNIAKGLIRALYVFRPSLMVQNIMPLRTFDRRCM